MKNNPSLFKTSNESTRIKKMLANTQIKTQKLIQNALYSSEDEGERKQSEAYEACGGLDWDNPMWEIGQKWMNGKRSELE
jgi:hypothetical protein